MFGGHGLYVEGVMFALIADEQIYLKADRPKQSFFVDASSSPFVYDRKDKLVTMSYYLLPIDIYENLDELKAWLDLRGAIRLRRSLSRLGNAVRTSVLDAIKIAVFVSDIRHTWKIGMAHNHRSAWKYRRVQYVMGLAGSDPSDK